MITQANMDLEELMDLFYQAFENNEDTNLLADAIVASTGLPYEIVGSIQAQACSHFAKNCF